MKDTVRLSFNVPSKEHKTYKIESIKSGLPIKDFLHNLVMLGMEEYKKRQFQETMKKSIQQAKEGKVRTVTLEELDRWEQEVEDGPTSF